jgi:hypothetical protein
MDSSGTIGMHGTVIADYSSLLRGVGDAHERHGWYVLTMRDRKYLPMLFTIHPSQEVLVNGRPMRASEFEERVMQKVHKIFPSPEDAEHEEISRRAAELMRE